MKFILFLQCLVLAAGVRAQTPRQRYTAVCDVQDGQSKTFDDGYEITYFCQKNGVLASLLTTQTADSPDECAIACKSYSGCKGSSWLYTSKECEIFGEGGAGEPVRATVFMRRDTPEEVIEEPDVLVESGSTHTEHALQDCEENKRELSEDLEDCRANQRRCQDDNEGLQDQLAHEQQSCQVKIAELQRDTLPNCPSIHDTVLTKGGKKYKAWCNRSLDKARTFYKQNNANFDECLEICAKESACKSVHWYATGAKARCKMYSTSTGIMGAFTTTMLVSLHKM